MAAPKLLKLDPLASCIYELLKPYGFNEAVCEDIVHVLTTTGSGQQYFSATHRLVKNRMQLLIVPISTPEERTYLIETDVTKLRVPFPLTVSKRKLGSFKIPRSPDVACIDRDKLKFPLTLRKWKQADAFVPLGMKTQKKLSDYFTDNKFSLIDKENTWLLISGSEIAWIVGERLDERYKVTEKTKVICIFKS